MNNEYENRQDDLLRKLIIILRRNWVLMLVIVLSVSIVGFAYAFVKKPVYTASSVASFSVSNEYNSQYNNNVLTNNFIDTMVDFCDEGYVISRANYYYDEYKKSSVHIDQFVLDVKSGGRCSDYQRSSFEGTEHILKSNITVESMSTDEEKFYNFTVEYVDSNSTLASEKVRLLILAITEEAKTASETDNQTHYFGYSKVLVEGTEKVSVAPDTSKKKIVIIFFLLGVVASVAIVYIKSALNHTIRDKDELEEITGTDLLSIIDYHGGNK